MHELIGDDGVRLVQEIRGLKTGTVNDEIEQNDESKADSARMRLEHMFQRLNRN